MFRLKAPSKDEIRRFLVEQTRSSLSYPEVGMTASELPSGYNIDHHRILLGNGEVTWRRAMEAIRTWQMFSLRWVCLYWPTAPIELGTNVAISVLHFGFYSLHACRIVYVVDDDGPVKRYGFAYGTLEGHAESGEERFTVEWNQAEDKVVYEILAFSRPNKIAAKLGYLAARYLQRAFAGDSMEAMLRAIR